MGQHGTKGATFYVISRSHPELLISYYTSEAWSSKMEGTLLKATELENIGAQSSDPPDCRGQVDLRIDTYVLLYSLAESVQYL